MGFLTDPIPISKHALVSSLVGLGEKGNAEGNEEIKEIAGEVTHKCSTQPGEKLGHNEEEEDGDGSMFEDLDIVGDMATTKKTGKAKRPAKSVSTTDKWTATDWDAMHKNRYSLDLPDLAVY